jgi:hypothetical protein
METRGPFHIFHIMSASWTKTVIKHKPPHLAALGAGNVEYLPAVNTKDLVSTRGFTTFRTCKCAHLFLFFSG